MALQAWLMAHESWPQVYTIAEAEKFLQNGLPQLLARLKQVENRICNMDAKVADLNGQLTDGEHTLAEDDLK